MSAYTAAYSDVRVNDNARFRTQGQWIADQLTNIGWTKTADTGQIDWSTVTAPAGANTAQGYEIRKSSENLYMKIEYGAGYAAYSKSLWFTFGTGSDGAGAITGENFARNQLGYTAIGYSGGSARAGDDFVSGSATRFAIGMTDDTSAAYGVGIVFQRTTDPNGTEDGAGWWIMRAGYSQTGSVYFIPKLTYPGFFTSAAIDLGTIRYPRSVGSTSAITMTPIYAPHPTYGAVALRDAFAANSSHVTFQGTETYDGRTYANVYGGVTAVGVWGIALAYNHSLMMRYD